MMTSRGRRSGSSGGADDAIAAFNQAVSRAQSDEWQRKVLALERLVEAMRDDATGGNGEVGGGGGAGANNGGSPGSIRCHDDDDGSIVSQQSMGDVSYDRLSINSRGSTVASANPSVGPRRRRCRNLLSNRSSSGVPWCSDPISLRRLGPSFKILLSDLRSQVVRAACSNLAAVSRFSPGDSSRLLIRDVLPDVIKIHGQTVRVMHGYATSAMKVIIRNVKFFALSSPLSSSSGGGGSFVGRGSGGGGRPGTDPLSVLTDNARTNKCKDVRSACIRYLREILECWPVDYLEKDSERMGRAFAKSLMDPSQQVRSEGKAAFDAFYIVFPDVWNRLVVPSNRGIGGSNGISRRGLGGGCVITDPRLRKTLLASVAAIRLERQSLLQENRTSTTSSGAVSPGGGGGNGVNDSISAQPRSSNGQQNGLKISTRKQQETTVAPALASVTNKIRNPFQFSETPPKCMGRNIVVASSTSVEETSRDDRDSFQLEAVEKEMREVATVAIQAVARGVSARKSLLGGFRNDVAGGRSRESMLGLTASKMAERRKSTFQVLPLPPTPEHELSSPVSARPSPSTWQARNGEENGGRRLFSDGNNAVSSIKVRENEREASIPEERNNKSFVRKDSSFDYDDEDEALFSPLTSQKWTTANIEDDSLFDNSKDKENSNELGKKQKQPQKNFSSNNENHRKNSSVLLKQRLRRSSVACPPHTNDNRQSPPPEADHVGIAADILRAHKKHIHEMMDTLKEEKKLLDGFENIGYKNASEDDVLKYFEAVELYLDHRTAIHSDLRNSMHRISHG